MLDLKDLLNKDAIHGILSKLGVDQENSGDVINAALETINEKFSSNGTQMVSMLSQESNTADDEILEAQIEEGFLNKLSSGGASESLIQKLKGAAIPMILNFLREKIGGESGGMSILSTFLSKDENDKDGGLLGGLGDKISKLF
ncbi:hypothetical protein SAMN05216474_1462 [Lishizhenia tianjinensis]|uniref:DUF937 domain-containing protein n=1 Tax=Lishizhenia tianjinensis TaxID=477690 RepID=A0A1I6ZLK2_9FLAO|nr:hypothetical protein [Lishizhenia tianjinensis]SFT63560.1 hypothetical protein SAMN05216474_1462 [Lishizhenia tianjinensis]